MPRSWSGLGYFIEFAKSGMRDRMLLASVAALLASTTAAAQPAPAGTVPAGSVSTAPVVSNSPSTSAAPPTSPSSPDSARPGSPTAGQPSLSKQSNSTGSATASSQSQESPQAAPVPAPAPTPEQLAQARATMAQGQSAYASGDYVLAETLFRQALAAAPGAAAQHGLAMALDLQGKATEAFEAYAELFTMPDLNSLDPDQVAAARQRHSVLATIPATVELAVTSSDPTEAVADVQLAVDGVAEPAAGPFVLKLAAGSHELNVSAPGYEPLVRTLVVRPAESLQETIALTAVVAPPVPAAEPALVEAVSPPATPPAPVSKTPAYVTLGVAGAAAVVGTIFGVQALGAKSKFEDAPSVSHADDVERNALIADMAFGIAFTLGITGVVLLTSDEPATDTATAAHTEQTALRLFPVVSPSTCGAGAQLLF